MYRQTPRIPQLQQLFFAEIDEIINQYENDSTRVVGILLDIQAATPQQYIDMETAYYVAEKLQLPITQIYDVISFFTAFSTTPRAKYVVQICDSIVCRVNKNHQLIQDLEQILGISFHQVTYDGKFTLERTPCFGACDVAPAVRINGQVFGNLVNREKIQIMLDSLL